MAGRKKNKNVQRTLCLPQAWEAFLSCPNLLPSFFSSRVPYTSFHRPDPFHKEEETSVRSKRSEDHASKVSNIAYRFRGYPDELQQKQLLDNINGCRFFWNRLVGDSYALYREMGVHFNNTPADYKDASGLEWLAKLDSYALCNVQLNFNNTYHRWLSGECGCPKFKKKGLAKASYTSNKDKRCDNLKLEGGFLTLTKIDGAIRLVCHREVMEGAVLKTCTITQEPDGKWMFSLVYEYERPEETYRDGLSRFLETGDFSGLRHIGLDMSVPHLYIDSDGNTPFYVNQGNKVTFEKYYHALEERIGREQRRLSRMELHSENYEKQCRKVARLHAKAKQQRSDFLNQVSHRLARDYDVIFIEDLDIAAMKRGLKLGKSVSDNGWAAFVAMLERKCAAYGHLVIRVSKWFPSSKTCSRCGYIHRELKLSDRTYICPKCRHVMDRDHQAAVNIDREGIAILEQIAEGEAVRKAA